MNDDSKTSQVKEAAAQDDGGPAFPCSSDSGHSYTTLTHSDGRVERNFACLPGMSLRDYFAAAALQGLCASDENETCDPDKPIPPQLMEHARCYAEASYRYADAMLAAREAKTGGTP